MVPVVLKEAVAYLFRESLDLAIFNYYQPVSNLPFLRKVIDSGSRLFGFLSFDTILALASLLEDTCWHLDVGSVLLLVLLELSAVSSTINHSIPLNYLKVGNWALFCSEPTPSLVSISKWWPGKERSGLCPLVAYCMFQSLTPHYLDSVWNC